MPISSLVSLSLVSLAAILDQISLTMALPPPSSLQKSPFLKTHLNRRKERERRKEKNRGEKIFHSYLPDKKKTITRIVTNFGQRLKKNLHNLFFLPDGSIFPPLSSFFHGEKTTLHHIIFPPPLKKFHSSLLPLPVSHFFLLSKRLEGPISCTFCQVHPLPLFFLLLLFICLVVRIVPSPIT